MTWTFHKASPESKTQQLAFLMPLLGLFLLMPPAVLTFTMPTTVAGVPLIVLYIFAVWGLVIIGTALLARRLTGPTDIDQPSSKRPDFGTSSGSDLGPNLGSSQPD
jgi:hypothetical protein